MPHYERNLSETKIAVWLVSGDKRMVDMQISMGDCNDLSQIFKHFTCRLNQHFNKNYSAENVIKRTATAEQPDISQKVLFRNLLNISNYP